MSGVGKRSWNGDDGKDGDDEAEECGGEAKSRGEAEPARETMAERGRGKDRDGEHGHVGESVVGDRGDDHELECLLNASVERSGKQDGEDEQRGEEDGVGGSFAAGMDACEPVGEQVIPSGGEGEPTGSGEDEAGGADEAKLERGDGGDGKEIAPAGVSEGEAKGLRDGRDDVDGAVSEGEDGAGAEDEKQADDG